MRICISAWISAYLTACHTCVYPAVFLSVCPSPLPPAVLIIPLKSALSAEISALLAVGVAERGGSNVNNAANKSHSF